ncbi:MAG: cell division protease FtsH [Bradymonadia bacterium]|jgi:cell division protease FtsH
MSRYVPEHDLPVKVSLFDAVEVAYPDALQRITDALLRGLPVLVECDKSLTPYAYRCIRQRLKAHDIACMYLDGRSVESPDQAGAAGNQSLVATIISQLRDAVRGAADSRVVVLPHLDLLTSARGGLTSEAREVIPLMYENPRLLWLGFADPSFPVLDVVSKLFHHRVELMGVPRGRVHHLVTQRDARKLGREGLDVYGLYTHVSGVNAVRLRQMLSAVDGVDYPEDTRPVWRQIREATLTGGLQVPEISLHDDIGGYAQVKQTIQREILDVITHMESLDDPDAIARVESLIPRGMIFHGPPGTGKTLFAKAIATSLGAAVQIIAGPELKTKWVGESERKLRDVFTQARQSAPALIVFDEMDSFASARGMYSGSGVEHSMVNQLLTELDGFRDNEMVFVIGTTNFPESLDAALLRPGRLEFKLRIPYPDADDREAVLRIYDRKLDLHINDDAMQHAVKQTSYPADEGTRWSGDHLQALCRRLARARLRTDRTDATTVADVDAALIADRQLPTLTPDEEFVVATHECGHAIVAMHCPNVPAIDRISIRGDLAGTLGAVHYADPAHRYVVTQGQMRDTICTLFGGREAESVLLDDVSIGAAHDLERATQMARALVEEYGMGPPEIGARDFKGKGDAPLADSTREALDAAVKAILAAEQARARVLIQENRAQLIALRTQLIAEKIIDAKAMSATS